MSIQQGSSVGPLASLDKRGRKAFVGAAGGWALDSYDYQIFPLSLAAIATTFALTTSQTGWVATVTLVVSALGGVCAGLLADRIGRVRTLMVTVAVFSVFTMLCAFAPNYETLLIFRALQGLGFGGEWAAGAALMAEYARAEHRGKLMGAVQSAWAIGWGLAVAAYTIVFTLVDDETWAWRVLFASGALPALFLLYIRRGIKDPDVFVETKAAREQSAPGSAKDTFTRLFSRELIRRTLLASLLATGVQGGYYAIITWLPSFLRKERDLSVIGTSSYLLSLIVGSFLGYLFAGYIADKLGRRATFAIFAVLSAALVITYTNIPAGHNTLMLILGVPLGFFASGLFSGFGSYLAELFPSAIRATGQGFCYNAGRAIGALFPLVVGYLATTFGTGGAIAFGAFGYALALVALLGLPETKGLEFAAEKG